MRGVYSEPEDTLLTSRAAEFLSAGPADVVDLIGHICCLPGAPRIVAEHMAQAMFSGRREFVRNAEGRWMHSGLGFHASVPKGPTSPGLGLTSRGLGPTSPGLGPTVRSAETPAEALCGLSYVVVDVETTGGRAFRGDRITEIAAVVVRDGQVREVFETLVNPERSIPPFITQLTNITWEMVKDAPTFDRIAPDLLRVLEGNVFVAHNATFDWRFVTSELSRSSGRKLGGRRLCTVRLARKVLPQLSRRSLDNVARYYGIGITARHRAAGDALATAQCLLRMISDLADRGCATWDELDLLLGTPSPRRKKRRRTALPAPVRQDTSA